MLCAVFHDNIKTTILSRDQNPANVLLPPNHNHTKTFTKPIFNLNQNHLEAQTFFFNVHLSAWNSDVIHYFASTAVRNSSSCLWICEHESNICMFLIWNELMWDMWPFRDLSFYCFKVLSTRRSAHVEFDDGRFCLFFLTAMQKKSKKWE